MKYWIVVVDDEAMSLTNIKTLLSSKDMKVSCLRSGRDLLTFMEKNDPDLILLDVMMPDMSGFETYKSLRKFEKEQNRQETPIIFLTGESDFEAERYGLKLGAADYIHKPFNEDILLSRISNTINNSKKIESLTEDAIRDSLTGFLNKTGGISRVADALLTLSGSLLMLDLDSFKLVNDLFGHDKGDLILQAFADVARASTREGDILCRIGGDEFLALCNKLSTENAVSALTTRLNERLQKKAVEILGEDHGIPLGISVGAVMVPKYGRDYDTLFKLADEAMYRAKENGKHGYFIYSGSEDPIDRTQDPEEELSRIIKIITERNQGREALILGTDAFSTVFHFIERFNDRYGRKALTILVIVAERKPVEQQTLKDVMTTLGETLRKTLRKSDIIMQSRANQYFVLLPMVQDTDAAVVTARIESAWEEVPGHEDFDIKIAARIR